MGVRRRGREYALQMLYAMDVTGYQPDQVFAGFYAIQDLNRDAFYYARRLVDGVHGHLEEIDTALARYAEHWKIHRMAVVDRNLLRLGLYELMFVKEIPFPIVINEALEIVKEFSDQEGTQFLNGILDAARKEFRAEETGPRSRRKAEVPEPDEES
ncbi:N utilization substance protein B [Geothrix rubra]|uniref:Transcription antitermination protein NusB n=1 Tax=Geothrix rubra TaxID=2927977 RepID=A0ABQ5Q7A8_9BACT|nr:transcription antitermination factor NusB [Geothrix rubra]GLH70281.1 N utilization substance protein B [Geothrix rubra]